MCIDSTLSVVSYFNVFVVKQLNKDFFIHA